MQNAGIPDGDIRGFVQDVITAQSILDAIQDGQPEEDYAVLTLDDNMTVIPEIGDISADN